MADIDPVADSITTVDEKTSALDVKFPAGFGTFQEINDSLKAINNSIKDHEARLAEKEAAVVDLQVKVDAHNTRLNELEKI